MKNEVSYIQKIVATMQKDSKLDVNNNNKNLLTARSACFDTAAR